MRTTKRTTKPAAKQLTPRQLVALENRIAAGLAQLGPSAGANVCRSHLIGMLETENHYAREAADAVLRADYWRDVRALAEEAVKEHPAEGEERDRWLHETIDGYERVIYTAQAAESLAYSGNADAMEEEMGEAGTVEQRCYFALLADVREQIAAIEPEPAAEEA